MNTNRLERLLEMRKEDPQDPFLIYAIGMEYSNGNEPLKALDFYEELTTNHENYVGTYYHLAKLYEKLERRADAELCFQKGMSIARKIGDNHAFNELQTAYRSFQGIDEDEY